MRALRVFALKSAAIAAVLLGTAVAGGAPASAESGDSEPLMFGMPYVGSELTMGEASTSVGSCAPVGTSPRFVIEWLSNGVPLPAERQGESLKLIPEDRGNRISFTVHGLCTGAKTYQSAETAPIAASTRASGWTGRGNFELLARTDDGELVLYPRTYESEWGFYDMNRNARRYSSSWDEPKVVGTGWNIFDIVFSPGDFDGDGNNDILARDTRGNLYLYPGDGQGGWLAPSQVGSGWQIFDKILGAGDFTGDGNNDILARDFRGNLYIYPGDGQGGWLSSSRVGSGWQIFDEIIAPGDASADGGVDIFARGYNGVLYQYPVDALGRWGSSSVVGSGWDVMSEISGAGVFSPNWTNYDAARGPRNDVIGIDQEGDLRLYSPPGHEDSGLEEKGTIGIGWNIFKHLI